MILTIPLIIINLISVITLYFLNETIGSLHRENQKLVGEIQNLHNEIMYLNSAKTVGMQQLQEGAPVNLDALNYIYPLLGALTVVILGLTVLVFLKNDTAVIAELSKNSIQSTGDYVKEVIVPSVELLNKTSESRINANIENVQKVVTETGVILTKHVTEVNKEGVLCIVNTIGNCAAIPPAPKVLGKLSRELLNLMP